MRIHDIDDMMRENQSCKLKQPILKWPWEVHFYFVHVFNEDKT